LSHFLERADVGQAKVIIAYAGKIDRRNLTYVVGQQKAYYSIGTKAVSVRLSRANSGTFL